MSAAKRGFSLQNAVAKSVAQSGGVPTAAPALAPTPSLIEERTVAAVKVECFVTDEDRDRLKRIGIDTKMSLQQIQHEALSQWLAARGHQALTPQTASRPSGRRMK